jgi:hypothetical protein
MNRIGQFGMETTMRRTRSQAVSACLLAIGLVSVKNFFGYLWHLALGAPGRQGCPRLTLHEDVTQPGSPQKECRVCPNQPHAGVGSGWSRRDRGLQLFWCPTRTPEGTRGIHKRLFREHGNEHWSPS